MKRLYTIGYEGAALEDFLATLNEANVDIVLDVRELPKACQTTYPDPGQGVSPA